MDTRRLTPAPLSAIAFLAAAMLASYLAARRATKVRAVVALRREQGGDVGRFG